MTFDPSDPNGGRAAPSSDDTAAFQRFYLGDQQAATPASGRRWYQAVVTWWKGRAGNR